MISVNRFTKSAQEVALRAAEIMHRYGHHQLDVEHQLLALIEQPQGIVSQLLERFKVDATALSARLDTFLRTAYTDEIIETGPGQVSITPRVARTLELAIEEAARLKDELVSDEHLFLAILSETNTPTAKLLGGTGLTHDSVYNAIQEMRE